MFVLKLFMVFKKIVLFIIILLYLQDLINASYTLFRTILGDFNFEVIEQVIIIIFLEHYFSDNQIIFHIMYKAGL